MKDDSGLSEETYKIKQKENNIATLEWQISEPRIQRRIDICNFQNAFLTHLKILSNIKHSFIDIGESHFRNLFPNSVSK